MLVLWNIQQLCYHGKFKIWQEYDSDILVPNHNKTVLTHRGLVAPYGDRDLGQHWLR